MFVKVSLWIGLIGIIMAVLWMWNVKDPFKDAILQDVYDYVIVGAGTAGSILANRLSEDGNVSVLLLEVGGSEYGNPDINVPLRVANTLKSDVDWVYYTQPQKHSHFNMKEQRGYWPRGRVLGGSSSINYMAYVRGSRHDYDQWEKEGSKGWSYKDVLPYFLKAEDIDVPEYYNSEYHSRGGYMTVRESKVTTLPDIYRAAAEEIGYTFVDLNAESQLGFSNMQSSVRNGERCGTAKAYLRPAMERPNLHISINSLVTKVLIDSGSAYGVEVIKDNKKYKILSRKEVIISAGAINSPVLLMQSGIGPKQHLEGLKIPVLADLPVGQYLEDHLMVLFRLRINQSYAVTMSKVLNPLSIMEYMLFGTGVYSAPGLEGDIFSEMKDKPHGEPQWPDFQLQFTSVVTTKEVIDDQFDMNYKENVKKYIKTTLNEDEFLVAVIQTHPKSIGNIKLNTSDPYDYPLIQPNYLADKADINSMIAGIRTLQQLEKTKTLQRLGTKMVRADFPGICDNIQYDSDDYWECLIRHYGMTGFHPSSTCRMGSFDDETAVVDNQLRVKGIHKLRVADASVMRHVTSGNINAPVIMIAERASDMIKGKDTVQIFREQIKHIVK